MPKYLIKAKASFFYETTIRAATQKEAEEIAEELEIREFEETHDFWDIIAVTKEV